MAKKPQMKLECHFGRVGLGDVTGSVPVKFSRGNIDIEVADEVLCGRRLDVRMIAHAKGENPDQKRLPGMDRHETEISCDIAGYRVSPKSIGATMKFSLDGIDEKGIGKFAMRDGVLVIKNVGEMVSEPEDDVDEE
jgi:hypothetical protein